ncbi:P2X purinoceptor 1 [Varanus komodoensis]|nr:P2X purinoceptor 1 [Varanus komodoensis]
MGHFVKGPVFCLSKHPEAGKCEEDRMCTAGKFLRQGQGIMTGKCVNFSRTERTCEIFGWCPVEIDDHVPNPPLLLAAENFTLFIKNSITFPKFKVNRRNLVERVTKDYLRNCTYHKVRDPLCPVFQLGYVVEESGQKFSMLARKGGVLGISISWNCDLDWPVRHCMPVYQFHGLYNEDSSISPGFNFRYARYYRENGRELRTLYKVFGIRFDILVNGKAGKFDIIPTMTTIGSGIGIFGVASVLCDLLLLNFISNRHYYKQKKFKNAELDSIKPEKEDAVSSFTCDLQEKEKKSYTKHKPCLLFLPLAMILDFYQPIPKQTAVEFILVHELGRNGFAELLKVFSSERLNEGTDILGAKRSLELA